MSHTGLSAISDRLLRAGWCNTLLLVPLILGSCQSPTEITAPTPAASPGAEESTQPLNSSVALADDPSSARFISDPVKGHQYITKMAIRILSDRNMLPDVYKGNLTLGYDQDGKAKTAAKTDLLAYGADFADHVWLGRPADPAAPVMNHVTDLAYGRARCSQPGDPQNKIDNCSSRTTTADAKFDASC
jgi:hypothetical protein